MDNQATDPDSHSNEYRSGERRELPWATARNRRASSPTRPPSPMVAENVTKNTANMKQLENAPEPTGAQTEKEGNRARRITRASRNKFTILSSGTDREPEEDGYARTLGENPSRRKFIAIRNTAKCPNCKRVALTMTGGNSQNRPLTIKMQEGRLLVRAARGRCQRDG